MDYLFIGLWILLGTILIAIIGHPLWLLYAALLRKIFKIGKKPSIHVPPESGGPTEKEWQTRFYSHVFSGEGLKYVAYFGSIVFALAFILLLKDFIARLLTIRYVQFGGLVLFTVLTYGSGWKLFTRTHHRILANVLLLIGAILFPVNFWYYQVYILEIESRDHYLVGFLCTILYFLTAVRLSHVIFSYLVPLGFYVSLLLFLYRLDEELEWFILVSTLMAVFYAYLAEYLQNQNKPFFKYPLIMTSLTGLLFSAISFPFLKSMENTYLPVYLFICGILVLYKVTQIQLDFRYLFLGIPFVGMIYTKYLTQFDLASYWIGIFFSTLSLIMAVILWLLNYKTFLNTGFSAHRDLHTPGFSDSQTPLNRKNLKALPLLFLAVTLMIFSFPMDFASYVYLVYKSISLYEVSRLYLNMNFSFDLLGEMWKGLQISIYYLGHFSFMSIVILFSMLFTAISAAILGRIILSRILGFYSILAFLGFFTVTLIRFRHPLLYLEYYFLFYLGLAVLSLFLLLGLSQKSGEISQIFTPPLYTLTIVSLLISYVLAGRYFNFSLDRNFDYYLCTLSLFGIIILALTHSKGFGEFPRARLFGALATIVPVCLSSFVDWTSYTFFIFATITLALIYLVYGWIRQDMIFAFLGILFLLIQVIYILATVQPGQVLIKLILLTLGMILIGLGIYLKKWSTRMHLLPFVFCFLCYSPAWGASPADTKSKLDRLVKMSLINPEDELLKARIRRYAIENQLPVPDLPISEVRNQFHRVFLKDNLAVVTAARAIEGTLQLDALRQRIYRREPQDIEVTTLQPVLIRSYNYQTLLEKKGLSRPIPHIARIVPEDKIYVGFKNFRSLYQFINLWDTFVVQALNYLMTSVSVEPVRGLLESQLGISEKIVTTPEWNDVEEIALLFGDPYLQEGTDISLIVRFSREDSLKAVQKLLLEDKQEPIPTLPEKSFTENLLIGTSPSALSQGDLGKKTIIRSMNSYLIISNDAQVVDRIQNGQDKKLAESLDFLYLYNLNLPGKDGFFFLGEGFIRKLTSPAFKIKDLRRHTCHLILEDLQTASLLFSVENRRSEPVTISKLTTGGYLPYLPLCPDRGEYQPDDTGYGFACSIHGRPNSLTHLESLSVHKITQTERTEYERFKAQYESYFSRFIDPIGVGIGLEDHALQLSTVVLPLVNDPLYTHLLRYMDRSIPTSLKDPIEGPSKFFVFNNITPDYGITTAIRSSMLKNILNTGLWPSNYAYFHRILKTYLDDSIFGNELVVGVFDFKFPGKIPKDLKELARAQIEVPLFLIQNLEQEGKAWEYLQVLFPLASTESYKGIEIKKVNIVGYLNIYGTIVRKLFVLSTSSEAIKRIIDFPQISRQKGHLLEVSMPEVDLQTEINFDKIPQLQGYLLQLVRNQMKGSCKENLVTLQNLLELSGGPKSGLDDSEVIQDLLKFGNVKRPLFCPEGGRYFIENNQVYCSIHNSLENYVEPEEITEKFFLLPLFTKLEKLLTQLHFMEDGILSRVELFFK